VIENKNDLPRLPHNWTWTTTSEVCSSVRDGTHETPRYVENGVPLITSKNLKPSGLDFATAKNISLEDHQKIGIRSGVDDKDVLFAMIGTIGNPVVVHTKKAFSIKNVALFKKNESFIKPEYLKYWLENPVFKKLLEEKELLRGTTQKFIPLENLRILPVPLAPFSEQVRIVARLEELFARLDAGVEGLRKVKAQLKRYRQAVLKYAFEGRLTEEWRKTHKDQLEPATKLLEHIKQERRKDPKHKELPPINIADLSELPENWTWTRLGEIGIVASGGTPSTKILEYFDGDVPWITPADLSDFTGKFIHRGRRNISEKGLNSSSAVLLPEGTILFSSRAPIGYVAIAVNPVSTNQGFKNLILYKGIFSEYVFYYLKASKILAESYGSGTTFREVSAARFSLIPIPLASLNEQHRIVEEIEQRLSLVYETQKTIAQAIRQSDQLRQSILKRVFEGRLVSQDPSDEPAEKLLERIREERAKSEGEKDINKKKIKPKQLELSSYVE
jgi:type I restriction enzyme S subunit